jgi:peroxiredoxin
MKKILIVTTIIIVAGLTTFLIIGTIGKVHKSKIAKEKIKTLPAFSFKKLDGTIFSADQIKEGPVLILFFHPECEHCQYQITTLFKKLDEVRNIHVLLISYAEENAIRNFIKDNNLQDSPGIIFLVDNAARFIDYFGTELVPATFIYNKKLKLIKCFQGEVRSETIIKYLRRDD